MILKIREIGDPILKAECIEMIPDDITSNETFWFVMDMFDTMTHYDGIGLAANQVGVNKRLIAVQLNDRLQLAMVNPKILEYKNWSDDEEGCLSIPDKKFIISRAQKIKIKFVNLQNETKITVIDDPLIARIIQHEVDHLNGLLLEDK